MQILGNRLLALRKEKGLTQRETAKSVGISFNSYCRYELGEREPTASTILAMAGFFQVSTDFLLGRTDTR